MRKFWALEMHTHTHTVFSCICRRFPWLSPSAFSPPLQQHVTSSSSPASASASAKAVRVVPRQLRQMLLSCADDGVASLVGRSVRLLDDGSLLLYDDEEEGDGGGGGGGAWEDNFCVDDFVDATSERETRTTFLSGFKCVRSVNEFKKPGGGTSADTKQDEEDGLVRCIEFLLDRSKQTVFLCRFLVAVPAWERPWPA